MKKLLSVAFVAMSFFACTDSDDSLDPFVGNWYYFSDNGVEVDECKKKSTVIILENGKYTFTGYEMVDKQCILDNTANGNWANKGNGNYGLTNEGSTEERVNKVTFSDNGNTFTFTEVIDQVTETTVYKRKQ
ncbi:Lipocalin-like domain-containing protein [Tenacibaculum sp. 190130A14a]|uniref:Lipocalin-like domain-containing protein n=1 Tax=Tenacibaculum polynesiense TaxID=3137857 RepID=A0ABM9PCT0_9FLAO